MPVNQRIQIQISKSCYLDPSTRYLSTMKSTRIAVFLLSGSAASVSAELNVAKMLILKDRANNNANTTSVLLGESSGTAPLYTRGTWYIRKNGIFPPPVVTTTFPVVANESEGSFELLSRSRFQK